MTPQVTLFRALADETRLRIARLTHGCELTVGDLAQILDQSQPRVSRHVKILAEAGLVTRYREGAWVFVRYAETEEAAAVTQLLKLGPDHGVDAERLAALRAERLAASTAYFDAQADDWDRLRELHVADSEVEAAVVSLLCTLPLGRLVDVGTGTGRMLELLAARSDSALGIDRSVDMLRAARAKLDTLDLPHCSLRHGDMHALPSLEQAADTVVMHQVLHFAEKPSLAIQEAARILAPGGRLLIADFAPHDREELRRDHAHARLGFADDVVRTWLRRAGLQLGETRQLEGPLTVTIWLAGKPQRRDRKAA